MSQGESKQTTDHETIRKWAEERGGKPAQVKGTGSDHDAGLLRFEFDEKEDKLEAIPWDDFFEKFDEKKLAMLYQDKLSSGKTSRFFKFVSR